MSCVGLETPLLSYIYIITVRERSGNTYARRSVFLENLHAAIIFPIDQIYCGTGPARSQTSTAAVSLIGVDCPP